MTQIGPVSIIRVGLEASSNFLSDFAKLGQTAVYIIKFSVIDSQ